MTQLKYNQPMTKEEFKTLTSLSLSEKIKLSREIIIEFMENIDTTKGKAYISSSFGKDSIVVSDLVRKEYPDMPIVYNDSGCEYPECVELAKKCDNVIWVQSEWTIEEVVEKEGYLLPIGREKSKTIRRCRDQIAQQKWYGGGIKKMRGDWGEKSLYNYSKHIPIILAPFNISERCNDRLKGQPLDKFKRHSEYKYYFNGITYDESMTRRLTLIRDGFNIMKEKSRPIGHWSSSDVLEYILQENLEIPSLYGDIVKDEKTGKYKTTLFDRNGCYCCPAGAHMKKPNQYQLLYDYDYELWDYSINKLGFGKVMEYFDIPVLPDRLLKQEENNKEKGE